MRAGRCLAAALAILVSAACAAEEPAATVTASAAAPSPPEETLAQSVSIAAPTASPAPLVNGAIYFTDGSLNRVEGGVVTPFPDLPAIDVDWSPDGKRFLRTAPDLSIYVATADGSDSRLLTAGYFPAWSPDGSLIAFQRDRSGTTAESDIYVIAPDGSGERKLTKVSEGRETTPTWSTDGRRILFTRWATDGTEQWVRYQPDIVAVDIDGGAPVVVGQGSRANLSPDGTLAVLERRNEFVVVDVATGEQRLDERAASGPTEWSPDGTQLAYAWDDSVVVLDLATGEERVLPSFPSAVYVMSVEWSPDGTQIASVTTVPCSACYEGNQRSVLLAQSSAGADVPRLLADSASGSTISWQPAAP